MESIKTISIIVIAALGTVVLEALMNLTCSRVDVASNALITRKLRRQIITATVMFLFGGFLYFKFTDLLKIALRTELQVNDHNDFTKAWNKNPFPINIDIYVFSIENPDEYSEGAKARLKQYGPYTYDFGLYKEIISYSSDHRRVQFYDSQSFHFKPHESRGQLSDKVNVLNFPVYAMANMVRNLVGALPLSFAITPVAFGLVNVLFMSHGESMIKEITVGELLNGYPFSILDTIDTLTRPLAMFGIQLPDTGMPDNKFGFLWTKNFTKGGPYWAYSGQDGTDLLRLISWKGKNQLDFYPESRCNMINGTEGTSLELDVQKDKHYYFFTGDLCRSLDVVYQKDTWVNGIRTYRFIPNPKAFAAPSKNPLNGCFCLTPEREEWCDGIFDLSRCLMGAPAAYSNPHFLHASMAIRNNVENMEPDPKLHQAYIDVEPLMGAPVKGAEKIQMNGLVKAIPYLAGFRNVRETILPLIWFEKSAIIDDKYTTQFRMALYPIYVIYILSYILFYGGMLMMAAIAFSLFRKRRSMAQQLNNIGEAKSNSRSDSTEPLYQQAPSRPSKAPSQISAIRSLDASKLNGYRQGSIRQTNGQPPMLPARPPPHPNNYSTVRARPRVTSQNSLTSNVYNKVAPPPPLSRMTHSNTTTYVQSRRLNQTRPEQMGSGRQIAPLQQSQQLSALPEPRNKSSLISVPESEFYDQELMSQYYENNYDNKESDYMENTWTSINEVVLQPDMPTDVNSRVTQEPQEIYKHGQARVANGANNDRVTWSPPGMIE